MHRPRWKRWLGAPSGWVGACLGFGAAGIEGDLAARIVGALAGWLYGALVGWMVRRFRVHPALYPLVGLVVGPVPFAFFSFDMPKEDRGGLWAVSALVGLLIGFIEWGHRRAVDAPSRPSVREP